MRFNIGFLWAESLSLKKAKGLEGATRPHLHTLQPLHALQAGRFDV